MVMPVIGVIIGASLAPFFARKKRKKELKAEIFQNLFHYFQAVRGWSLAVQYQLIRDAQQARVDARLSSEQKNNLSREELMRQWSFFNGQSDKSYSEQGVWYREMLMYDGKLSYLCTEAEGYYRKKCVNLRNDIVTILHSYRVVPLRDYFALSDEELNASHSKVHAMVNEDYDLLNNKYVDCLMIVNHRMK
jgi:hypothetical protein